MATADPKTVVRRLINEVMNGGALEVIDELYAEDEKVVGRFCCSGTHLGPWRGHAPTGRRFARVDEVYIFRVHDGRNADSTGTTSTPRSASRAR